MDLAPHVARLRDELATAAAVAGPEADVLTERLTAALDAAPRLMLLETLAEAADEITRDLAPGSVELRLRGRHPGFAVTPPPVDDPRPAGEPPASDAAAPDAPEDAAMTRINLRLPDTLKARVEEAASREHLSVNTWLVRAASAALDGAAAVRPPAPRSGQSIAGWFR